MIYSALGLDGAEDVKGTEMRLLERKTLQEVLNPSSPDPNNNEPQMRLVV
jgi:hypothetical protein